MGKIKFKMSIKELSFDYEGDVETGQRIQGDIKRLLSTVGNTQERALGVDTKVIDADSVTPTNGNGAGNGKVRTAKTRRSKDKGPMALISQLRNDPFFSQPRTLTDIQAELKRLGHIFEAKGITSALTALVKSKVLQRTEVDNVWKYERGENDGVVGNDQAAE